MAANWTAVGRRLSVRRRAHRPPWSRRQIRHGSIVTPLTATIAASVAVGLAVGLRQAERTRRLRKSARKRERRFTQHPGEPLAQAMRRMALGQFDLAIELLGGEEKADASAGASPPDARAIHETRKALKRLRALLRLLRGELGEREFRAAHESLRDAARRLAGARDAEVMVGTLDGLLQAHPRKLGTRDSLMELRRLLAAEREAAIGQAIEARAEREEVLRELGELREAAQRWSLAEAPGIAILDRDLRRIYRQGRERKRLAARGKGGAEVLHEWRKRVKDLRYAAEILDLDALAKRADKLGELLGEEHDLAVLAGLLPAPGLAPFTGKPGKRARKALLEEIAARRRRLRKRALREGEQLYRPAPKKFLRRVRGAHAQRLSRR